jgi:hydroxyacylglutathione hydrolase
MERIRDDLFATEAEHPFPGLVTRAYLLVTPDDGNVLLYNTTHAHELDAMAELGGVQRQYLSHQDEVAPSLRTIRDRFGSALHAHTIEADLVREVAPVDVELDGRVEHAGGIEVIPTPGHTPGSVSYLVSSSTGARYLFTGDTLYVGTDDEWHPGYLPGHSDARPLAESLDLLGALRPDVVISSACPTGVGVHEVDPGGWEALVAATKDRLPVTA